MSLEILLSCMNQVDDTLIRSTQITGNVVVINQCDDDGYDEYPTRDGVVRVYRTKERGLTRSRNAAIEHARGDICLLCDDDEVLLPGYEARILSAYESLACADVIIFKMQNRPSSFPDRVMRLRFPKTAKVSSWQISFRRESLLRTGVRFDELLGAGSGNGAEEELSFLIRCERAGLRIYYVPTEIASVAQEHSTWFHGFTEQFFYDRGATTRYILGLPLASAYAIYYLLKKKPLYSKSITGKTAFSAIFRGIRDDRITKMARQKGKSG